MRIFEVENHAPSLLPKGDWELVWSDEFDGDTLDTTKWDYRLSMMGKRHPAWTDKGVKIEGTKNKVKTNNKVNTNKLGTYTITYKVKYLKTTKKVIRKI